ncbi:nicotinamide N-methyltransferase-like [Ylistrum balloti]|uniref:nicotinamide N-methyltransferase-like n=1 Tax=Ylistrum balloti TaxID=509963 RepID=UPI00290592A0|nr:nicotinamide N-methyltransferase-like [Ylistrum balloti]
MEKLQPTDDYAKFDPEWYLTNYVGTEEASINMRTDLTIYHQFFTQNNIRGKRLLDVGTGPSIHTLLSASNHVDEIILSDYTPQNRQYLENWLNGKTSHPKMMVDFVTSLEGRTVTAEEKENEIRQKVKGILHIDITSEQPLGRDYDGELFDVIITSYCFEAAVTDVPGYKRCIENVSRLLKKGGYLIIGVCLEGDTYQVGEFAYPTMNITKEQVDKAMKESGYEIIASDQIQGTPVDAQFQDFKSYYFFVGK